MDLVGYTILIPLIAGVIVRIMPDALKGLKEGIALAVSALTFYFTIVLFRQGWVESYYFGKMLFRVDNLSSFVLLFVGALLQGEHLNIVWYVGDTFNAFMSLPNLLALLFLTKYVSRFTKDYFADSEAALANLNSGGYELRGSNE